MGNQVAARTHTERGQELLCERESHIYKWELAGLAQHAALQPRTLDGGERGVITPTQVHAGNVEADGHRPGTGLLSLENTHNSKGGAAHSPDDVAAAAEAAHDLGIPVHLDGARLWNASVATGIPERTWAEGFDSVSVCFSKGLGAPVGSCLAGPADFIRAARRARKLFGGGMRQAGILAAGALYALEHQRKRLEIDHQHAQQLAATIRQCSSLQLNPAGVDTNIVICHVEASWGSAEQFVAAMRELGVLGSAFGPQSVRLVTHRDVDREQIARACQAVAAVAQQAGSAAPAKVNA
jgi:threonine aldolase